MFTGIVEEVGRIQRVSPDRLTIHGTTALEGLRIGDSIAVCPPLIIVKDEIDELLGCLGKALDATKKWIDVNGMAAA